MGKFPLASWSLMCDCHGHCDTLRCVVSIASLCLGNETGCPSPAVWIASKCGLRKCGEREKYRVCANVSGFFFLYSLCIDSLGKEGVNELACLLRDCSHISSQKILVFNEMHVRNILLSVKYVAKIFFFNFYFFPRENTAILWGNK